MTNAQILAQTERRLSLVKAQLRKLQNEIPTPFTMRKAMQLADLRDNLEISITDLKGAIAAGADNPNPLAGWC